MDTQELGKIKVSIGSEEFDPEDITAIAWFDPDKSIVTLAGTNIFLINQDGIDSVKELLDKKGLVPVKHWSEWDETNCGDELEIEVVSKVKRKTVVALRRYNPGRSRGNRPALEPIFEGEKIHPLWNLIAPPEGDFRIASLYDGDHAGYSPISPGKNEFTGHPSTAKSRDVSSREITKTVGLKETLIKEGLVKV